MTTAGGDGWAEGRDGNHRSYRERLYPPIAETKARYEAAKAKS